MLLSLPSDQLKLIESDDPAIQSLNFRDAIVIAHKHEQWTKLANAIKNADKWTQLLNSGISQANIARSEGMTRARVCQLIRLNQLDEKIKRLIRRRDERYYGVTLKEVMEMIQ